MRIILGITGASGAIYGIRILEQLKKQGIESHLVISKWGKLVIEHESSYTVNQVMKLADYYYDEQDLTASISSGSFRCDGMIIAPCSMKTLSGISNGFSHDLIGRAADVTIKERRKLILVVRETPLSSIHLENMLKLSREGVFIMPPVPAFYTKPQTVEELVMQTTGRVLDKFGLEVAGFQRWQDL